MPKQKKSNQKDWNYEATAARVEAIIEDIESGNLELAETFEQFALAVEYLQQCETFVLERKQKMSLLVETLTDEPDF
ncbi:MAG: exodeoxyribonuclease VII small subunit [Oscillatoria sp. SIO1A7]|nr:exodeoxyribonuclease VII small subunit [Oscillatoria sp. SIO1A7]